MEDLDSNFGSLAKNIKFHPMGRCQRCGQLYGGTNMSYRGAIIFRNCGCFPDKLFMINEDGMKIKIPEKIE